MKRMMSILSAAVFALVITGLTVSPSEAQLVLVNEVFRIVQVDHDNNRIGIAKPDASPNVRQNWVYVDIDTRGSYRTYVAGSGTFRDKTLSGRQVLNVADANKGQVMNVKGGRDWDGSIKAKTVHFKI